MRKTKDLIIYCDGASRGNPGKSACAFVVYEGDRKIFEDAKYIGFSTNNFAEYSAVLMAYNWMADKYSNHEISEIIFFLDSELVSKQLSGIYKTKNLNLKNIFFKIKYFEGKLLAKVSYKSIPREENAYADSLVNKVLDSEN